MKTNYILPLAAFAAGALIAKQNTDTVSGIGATGELEISSVVKHNFEKEADGMMRQWKHLKKYKTKGSLFVLRKQIELLNMWLDDIEVK